jgi:hypothetical protein
MMDFAQNGTNGFPLLLKRLRRRFPSAIIIYVKLLSVKSNAMEEATGKMMTELGGNPDVNWVWRQGASSIEDGWATREDAAVKSAVRLELRIS